MEQIAKLLFATTLLSIFSYLLFFWTMAHSGNGGEYWNYNGIVHPTDAARASYENRDYRFLVVNLSRSPIHWSEPEYRVCRNHPFGAENSLRVGSSEPRHNKESYQLAMQFAAQYNHTMERLLSKQMGYRCEGKIEEPSSPDRLLD